MPFTFVNFHNEAIISTNEFTLRLLVSCAKLRNNRTQPFHLHSTEIITELLIILNIKMMPEVVLSKELQITLTFTS
jgi:hypothetical protein